MNRLSAVVLALASLVAWAAGERGNAVLIRTMNGVTLDAGIEWDSIYSNRVLDFSGLERSGRVSARYFGRGDSIVMELMPDCRIDFLTNSLEGYRIIRAKGRTWRAEFL